MKLMHGSLKLEKNWYWLLQYPSPIIKALIWFWRQRRNLKSFIQKPDSHISQKVIETYEDKLDEEIYVPKQEELKKLELIKKDAVDLFNDNLTTIKQLIMIWKSTSIDSLIETIDRTTEKLEQFIEKFEANLNSITEAGKRILDKK